MKKPRQSGSTARPRSNSTPAVFLPAAIGVPNEDFRILDSQYAELEQAGDVRLSEKQKTTLLTLAVFWIDDLRLRRTARPKQFRECFDKMEKAFLQAEEACQWERGLEYHLVHWAMEAPVKDANVFPVTLAALELQLKTVRETVDALRSCLPPDPGRQRPFDDERRMIFLADIFEEAGGKAAAYLSPITGNMAETAFRSFAQQFYFLLPAEDKRDPGGLDQTLRLALIARRAKRSASS
jgi:hypothetical protein